MSTGMTAVGSARTLILGVTLILTGCAEFAPDSTREARQVQVMGRTWTVVPDGDRTNAFVAWRDNNNLNPFGRPAALRTPQAVRALQAATGCTVVPGRIYQTDSAEYHAEMACPVPVQTGG